MKKDTTLYITPVLERPKYYLVAEYLWGKDVDIDSDGNSQTPDDTGWTELTLINRSHPEQWIDIDPIQLIPLILKIKGPEYLAKKVANYLAKHCGCKVKDHINDKKT